MLYPDLNITKHSICTSIEAKKYPESADLMIKKDVNDTVLTSDENGFEYYLDITNNGPAVATDVRVLDTIPQYIEAFNGRSETNITADSNSSNNYNCTVSGANVQQF